MNINRLIATRGAALACMLPLGPMAGIVRYEYSAGPKDKKNTSVHCHHRGVDRLRCTMTTRTHLDGNPDWPIAVSVWIRVDWANGLLHGDFEPKAHGFDLSWTYRWACKPRQEPRH